QAEALRAAARAGSNEALDWEHLAEEIEDLGSSQRDALRSYITRIVQHLVKLEHSPTIEPRNGWRRSIRLARKQIEKSLRASPSLKPDLSRFIAEEMCDGIELAIADLEEYEEIDEVLAQVVRRTNYTDDQILGDWLPEEPRG